MQLTVVFSRLSFRYNFPVMNGMICSSVLSALFRLLHKIIQSLKVYEYLKILLEHRPSKEMTDEQLGELAPWSEKLQSVKNRM